jgi:hypothetical protein
VRGSRAAFGNLHGDMSMSAWFEDDTLWESLESFLFSQFRSSEITVREAEQILTLVHPP